MKISKYIILLFIPAVPLLSSMPKMPIEKVYVHTDRNIYVAGEDMLYSFYLISDEDTGPEGSSTVGYLEIISPYNKSVAQTRLSIINGLGKGVLSLPDSLTTGDYILRAYTKYMRNYGPGSFFTQKIVIYNPFKENREALKQDTINISLETAAESKEPASFIIPGDTRDTFGPREKVILSFRLDTASFSSAEKCNLSISVAVSAPGIPLKNIIHTGLEEPAGSDKEDPIIAEANLSQISMRNKPMIIADVKDDTKKPVIVTELRETLGPYLEGSVINRQTLEPVTGDTLYLSLPGKSTYLQYSITDMNGDFRFQLPPFRGNTGYIIQPDGFSNDVIIKTSSPYASIPEYSPEGQGAWNEAMLDYASRLGVNYQVNKIYGVSSPVSEVENKSGDEQYRFYGIPDVHVNLDDYIDLPIMEEVFHELVPGVALRRQGEGAAFVFVNEPGAPRLKGPDAVFLDGVILDDPSFIAGLDPDLIETIDVIRSEYQLGHLAFNGILSISSLEGDMCGIDYPNSGLRSSSVLLEKESLYQNYSYSDSIHTNTNFPDFRNTLYWNPDVKPDSEGFIEITFYTSDFLSEYSIVVQGFTDKKEAVYYFSEIKVTGN